MKMVNLYRGKKRTEVPAHLYSIADNAYANMLRGKFDFKINLRSKSYLQT